MTSVTLPGSGGTVTFKYDPLGRRIEKVSSAGTSIYAYDGDNLIEETNGSGTVVARYAQTENVDEPLAELRSSTTSYYEADGLLSVTSLTSSTGTLADTYTYDSFGNLTASSGSVVNPFRYMGHELDLESGLYDYRARYYDPMNGRFTSEDPFQFDGKDLNFFRFVRNQPTGFLDPFGTTVIDPNFNATCISNLQRALDIVRRVADYNKPCNCAFRKLPSHRSLSDLLDDPNITIHSVPDDSYHLGADGQLYVQAGYTPEGDTHNIFIRPFSCRMGRWFIASTIVHELTHVGQGAVPGDAEEAAAEKMEHTCGFVSN